MLDKQVLASFIWLDTRDMIADGLTKGSIDRSALESVCFGTMTTNNRIELWKTKTGIIASSSTPALIVNAITAQLEKSLNDIDRKHHTLKQFVPDDGNLKDMCSAVTAGLEGLTILEAVADGDAPPTPANYNEAMILDPKGWRASMVEEIGTLANMQCWDLVRESEMQPGDNLTGSTWTYKVKSKQQLYRKKSRACGRGFSQEFGRDYFEVYSGVVTAESLRLAIALAAVNKRTLKSYDLKNAYIWAFLPATDRVFMKQLPGFAIENVNEETDRQLLEWFKDIGMKVPEDVQPGEKLVCRIRRALYGLKSSARLHYANVAAWFIQEGFKILNSDDCIFVYHDEEENIDVEIYLYVWMIFWNPQPTRKVRIGSE